MDAVLLSNGVGFTVNKPSGQQMDADPQVPPGDERRRSQRVVIEIPVTLEMTISGTKAKVSAKTASVNDRGATLQCTKNLPAQTRFDLFNQRTGRSQSCRVTRSPTDMKKGYLVPVEFAVPEPGFWGISFPPPGWKPS